MSTIIDNLLIIKAFQFEIQSSIEKVCDHATVI